MLENVLPEISVIIPTWNGARFIEACLQSLFEHADKPLEVIIVDNASTDDTLLKARQIANNLPSSSQIHIVQNVMNTGFAHAVNQGLKIAKCDLFLLLNQDSQVKTDWLSPALEILSGPKHHKIGIVGCKLVDEQGQVSHLGGTVLQPLGEGFHFKSPENSNDIMFVTGAAMIITRQCYAEVGDFDERFFPAYYEDVDYCLRARQKGWQLATSADSVVLHHDSQSSRSAFEKFLHLSTQRLRYLMKHHTDAEWLTHQWLPTERERTLGAGDLNWLYALASAFKVILADVHLNPHFFEHLTLNGKNHILVLWATYLDDLTKIALYRIETLHLEAKIKTQFDQERIQLLEKECQDQTKVIDLLERTNGRLSFDNLVTQVKGELESVLNSVENQNISNTKLPEQKNREPLELSSLIRENKQYTLRELNAYHDEMFVAAVYYALLGRSPEVNGFTRHLNELRQGAITKSQLIIKVLHSSEGRQYGAKIAGLKYKERIYRLYRLPLIGRIVEICVYLYRLPQLMRQAEATFNMRQENFSHSSEYSDLMLK